jgi:hypothetical protein
LPCGSGILSHPPDTLTKALLGGDKMKENTEMAIALSVSIMKMISQLCVLFVIGFAIYAAITGFSPSKINVIIFGVAAFAVLQVLYRSISRKYLPYLHRSSNR